MLDFRHGRDRTGKGPVANEAYAEQAASRLKRVCALGLRVMAIIQLSRRQKGALAVAVVGIAATWLVPWIGLPILVGLWISIFPMGQRILTRLLLLTVSATVLGRVLLIFGPMSHRSAAIAVTVSTAALVGYWIASPARVNLRVGAADLMILVGAAIAGVAVALPAIGSEPQQIIPIFNIGWDNNTHFTNFANFSQFGSTPWPTADSSPAMFAGTDSTFYGFLLLVANLLFDLPASTPREALLWPYVVANSAAVAVSVCALGFVSVDLARRGGGQALATAAQRWAAIGLSLAAALGTLVMPLSDMGHTAFLFAAAISVGCAWIGIRSFRSRHTIAWFALPLGLLITGSVWAPLAVTFAVPMVALAAEIFRRRPRLLLVLTGVAIVGMVAILANPVFRELSLSQFATLPGGNSYFNLSLVSLGVPTVILGAVWLPQLARPQRVTLAAFPLPLTLVAATLAVLATRQGTHWGQSYYTLKVLNGVGLITVPVMWALLGVTLSASLEAIRSRVSRHQAWALEGTLGCVLLAALGYVGPGIWTMKPEIPVASVVGSVRARTGEARNSDVGVQVVAAAESARQFAGLQPIFLGQVDPLRNRWLATLAGVPTQQLDDLTGAVGRAPDVAAQFEAVSTFLDAQPKTSVLIVCPTPDVCQQVQDLAAEGDPPRLQITPLG